ncbi:choice-of-anchor Q domain-containing protein [Spirosoma spitsbergense]|uniref:choice-of-anchor Q domain-containing protein n=1 Tax=Spirosoma spitsbergense TaxID=431554 RepID=UPI00037DC710|nr:choice-of-anchor Q domain-containing protein [Spirosoma spitsbergense]
MTKFYSRTARFALPYQLLFLLLLSSLPALAQTTTRYVSLTGTNSNPASATSWATATSDLQGAIRASTAGHQVWVAKGIYKPTTGNDRTISFVMRPGVEIYGGFAGTETSLSQRPKPDLTAPSSTTLSGNIGIEKNADDNSYHVINNPPGLTADAILDGFVITGGYADRGDSAYDFGGGILNNFGGDGKVCSPTIQNCWFEGNYAKRRGGAIYNMGIQGGTSSPNISNCRFQNNKADEEGGAIYNDGYRGGNSNPTLTNCSFLNNKAGTGGAIWNSGPEGTSSPSLTNCSFQSNSATTNGGAIFNDGQSGTSNPILTNCSFKDNKATWGGALYNSGNSRPQITSCSFSGNSANNSGGAMYNQGYRSNTSPNLINCSFEGNSANNRGGAIYNDGNEGTSSPSLTNCSFQSNSAAAGGALYDFSQRGGNSNPILTNCSFNSNKAGQGGALYNNVDEPIADDIDPGNGHPVLVNCVFFGNGSGNTIYIRTFPNKVSGDAQATYSLFDELVTGYGGENNKKTKILPFASTTSTKLDCGSPAVNAGNNNTPGLDGVKTDLAGNHRIDDGQVDMGAYELQRNDYPSQLYVSATGTNTNPATATSWATATNDLQGAINSLCSSFPSEIWVATGLYKPSGTATDPRNNSFSMKNNIAIYGGFDGKETTLVARKLTFPSSTTLSGDIGKANDISDNSYHVFSNSNLTNTAILDGFVITAGNDNGVGGGGMHNDGNGSGKVCSPTIQNCYFLNNQSTGGGGAMFNSGNDGGNSSPVLINCAFQGNSANYGWAIYNIGNNGGNSNPILTNCSFQKNLISSGGDGRGAIYNTEDNGSSNPILTNCVFFDNGGNNTFHSYGSNSGITATYSLFEESVTGYTSGPGNLTVKTGETSPFVSTTNIQLACGSPAVNAGNKDDQGLKDITTDLAGNPRIFGAKIDMGAFEQGLDAGIIGGPSLVPYKQEAPTPLTSQKDALTTFVPSGLHWEKSETIGDIKVWELITNSNAQNISLPELSTDGGPNKTYFIRRVVDCNTASNILTIKVIKSDGQFSGKVVSLDGFTGVPGVTLTAVRTTTGLAGSPGSWTYTAVTESNGEYTIPSLYYLSPTTSVTASILMLTPSKTDPGPNAVVHKFTPSPQSFTFTEASHVYTQNFTDLSTFAITGMVTQTCPDCITGPAGSSTTGVVGCPLDGATIRASRLVNGNPESVTATTGYLSTSLTQGEYGRFAVPITNPGTYTLTATAPNSVFVAQTVPVTTNVYNLSFVSGSLQTITGLVTAGCSETVGQAVLEFADITKDKDGKATTCFKKRVTTDKQGKYTITLPPRLYKVTVISLAQGTGPTAVKSADFVNFFDKVPADSLIRDLTSTTAVVTLNLTYQRPPTLRLANFTPPENCKDFLVMQQAVPIVVKMQVFQGPFITNGTSATGCPVNSGTVVVTTAVRSLPEETLPVTVVNGIASLTLVPGEPNTVLPFYRNFNLSFTNIGKITTTLSNSVLVTGTRSATANFTTVSPEIPLLVLHHPPGGDSYSFWEKNQTQEHAMRIFSGTTGALSAWREVKLGYKFESGIGVETENKLWASVKADLTVSQRNSSDNEQILATTVNERIQTAISKTSALDNSDANLTGDDLDVFVGSALNMFYATATVISYDPATCAGKSSKQLIMGKTGVSTYFNYTAYRIKAIIVTLDSLSSLTRSDTDRKKYQNQISVWQQVLDNNAANKKIAKFVDNQSFSGGTNRDKSTTEAVTASNTVEFTMDIDAKVAIELGLEVAGQGASGGASVNFKMETGNTVTNTSTKAITTGYHLEDGNAGDNYSVDVRVDPVYGTPVFDVLAGASSCPPEPGTTPRDDFRLTSPKSVVRDADSTGVALTLLLSNISQVDNDATDKSRNVLLSLVPDSNPYGAIVTIGGNPTNTPGNYTVNRLTDTQITVVVKKDRAVPTWAYENLQFQVTDVCGGSPLATQSLSVFFRGPCSSVVLSAPEPNWVIDSAAQNSLPVGISGYTKANLTNITLQYRKSSGSWVDATELAKSSLNDGPDGTPITWSTAGLADGAYELRLKLLCASGVVYSEHSAGVLDRTAPTPVGNTQPTNDIYQTGSTIGISYSEPLDRSRITAGSVVAKSKVTGKAIPFSVGCYANQVLIVPTGSLVPSDVISLTLNGVADMNGNVRTTPDVWSFSVSSSTITTGSNALSIAVANSPLSERATGAMNVIFSRSDLAKTTDWLINFSLTGTAQFGEDYSVSYATSGTAPKPLVVTGASSSIRMPTGITSVTLLVDPIDDAIVEPDETVIISLINGGDYQISAASSASAVILNDDLPPTPNSLTLVSSASPTTLCVGGSVALSATATGGSSYSYTWAAPAGITLSGTSTSAVTASGITAGVRTFTVTATGASTATSGSKPSITSTVSVTVSALPTPTLTAGSSATLTCTQSSLTLTAGGGTVGAPFTYRFAGPNIASQNAATGTATVNASGTYSVTVTNAGGCVATTTLVVSEDNSSQRTQIAVQPASTSVVNAGVSVSVSVSAIGTNLTYQWRKEGTALAGATASVLSLTGVTTTQSGTYVCTVVGACGSATSQPFALTVNATPIVLAILEPNPPFQIDLFPNPATSDKIWVKILGATQQPVHLQLLDMKGRVIWEHHVKVITREHIEPLEIGNFPAGLLLLRVSTSDQTQVKKILRP